MPKKQAEVGELSSSNDSIINTVPLMKPAVQGLHSQALEYYQQAQYEKALATLKRAQEIQAAPQVMMLIAEISLRQGEFTESFHWSKLATVNGPSKGPICEKLWRILAVSAEMLGETPVQLDALEKKESCIVYQQNRF